MAGGLVDLTNVDPYAKANEASARFYAERNKGLQKIWDAAGQAISAGFERKRQNEEMRADEERVFESKVNQTIQTDRTDKFTTEQLEQVGRGFKQEYYDAVKAYESGPKDEEAKRALSEVKATSLNSAKMIAGSLEKIGASVDNFDQMVQAGNVSDATNPTVRTFLKDLADPNTKEDQYKIVKDANGALKYKGKTSAGEDVDFFLSDIAEGRNAFAITPKADIDGLTTQLSKQVSELVKEEPTEFGAAKVTDWDRVGVQVGDTLNKMFDDEQTFRRVAAELGYDYQAFETAKAEGGEEEMRAKIKDEMMGRVQAITPDVREITAVKPEYAFQMASPGEKIKHEAAVQEKLESSQAALDAISKQDPDYFKGLVGSVPGAEDVQIKNGKVIFYSHTAAGKAKPEQVFKLNSSGDKQRLLELANKNNKLSKFLIQ